MPDPGAWPPALLLLTLALGFAVAGLAGRVVAVARGPAAPAAALLTGLAAPLPWLPALPDGALLVPADALMLAGAVGVAALLARLGLALMNPGDQPAGPGGAGAGAALLPGGQLAGGMLLLTLVPEAAAAMSPGAGLAALVLAGAGGALLPRRGPVAAWAAAGLIAAGFVLAAQVTTPMAPGLLAAGLALAAAPPLAVAALHLLRRHGMRAGPGAESWRALVDTLPEAAAILRGGRVAGANAVLLGLLRQEEQLVAGRSLGDLFPRQGMAWLHAAEAGTLPGWSRAQLQAAQGPVMVEVAFSAAPDGDAATSLLLCRDLRGQLETEARLQFLLTNDPLTGLPNRSWLLDLLDRRLARARITGEQVALLAFGLDGFRVFNDVHGQAAGDFVLRELGLRLRGLMGPDATPARLAGDEFAVIAPRDARAEPPERLAERILAAIGETVTIGVERLSVGASLGIAVFPRDAETPNDLLSVADIALGRAKAARRGGIVLADPDRDSEVRANRALEQDLRLALLRREFRIWLQPQARCDDLSLIGFEALIRWQHPQHGLLSPARFIPVAEAAGMLEEIGAWVLDESARIASGWRVPVRIAVNVSPSQLEMPGFVMQVEEVLARRRLPPERLEIEVTETGLLENSSRARAALQRLKRRGIGLALDDFGTGYSSLALLRSLPFDKLKLDRSFLLAEDGARSGWTAVQAVLALGRAYGMRLLAEGVETTAQLERLRAEGCDAVQGYLIARPAPPDHFAHLVGLAAAPAAGSAKPGEQFEQHEGRQEQRREWQPAGFEWHVARHQPGPPPPPADQHGERDRDEQGEAEMAGVQRAEHRRELDVPAAEHAQPPARQQRGEADGGAEQRLSGRWSARQREAPAQQAEAGQQQQVRDPAMAEIGEADRQRPDAESGQPGSHAPGAGPSIRRAEGGRS